MDGVVRARVEGIVGARVDSWTAVRRGYTPSARWVVRLGDGSSAFVKVGEQGWTVDAVRAEAANYRWLRGAPFVPKVLGFSDDEERPVLVMEDLSRAYWPPPWDRARVEAVRATMTEVARWSAPADLQRAEDVGRDLVGWCRIAEDPTPFLSLGIASAGWLERSLPTLVDAEARAPFDGEDLLHLDVRSDNICLLDGRAILVDWNHACVGNARLDLCGWMPSLALEGGADPLTIVDDEPELGAVMAGCFAARAPIPPTTDWLATIRTLQLAQAKAALPWACAMLGLPPPDLLS